MASDFCRQRHADISEIVKEEHNLYSSYMQDKQYMQETIMDASLYTSWRNIDPDSKVHGANMGPTWVLSAPDGPHVGPWTLLSRDAASFAHCHDLYPVIYHFGIHYFYGLVPRRRNYIATALQLRHSYTGPSVYLQQIHNAGIIDKFVRPVQNISFSLLPEPRQYIFYSYSVYYWMAYGIGAYMNRRYYMI